MLIHGNKPQEEVNKFILTEHGKEKEEYHFFSFCNQQSQSPNPQPQSSTRMPSFNPKRENAYSKSKVLTGAF
jgi:hypothetical protein